LKEKGEYLYHRFTQPKEKKGLLKKISDGRIHAKVKVPSLPMKGKRREKAQHNNLVYLKREREKKKMKSRQRGPSRGFIPSYRRGGGKKKALLLRVKRRGGIKEEDRNPFAS